jgi:hypothetical protein
MDRGIVRLNWADAPDDFAVCLCEMGLRLRVDRNHTAASVAPLWRVWCAREQVDPSRMFLIEEVLTPSELRERGVREEPTVMDREAALLAAGKARKGRV